MQVQCLCCNDAGENVDIKKACKQERPKVDFEYTTPRNATTKWLY